MQQKIHYGILTFLYIMIVAFVIVLLYTNPANMLLMIVLLFCFILTFTLRNLLIYQYESIETRSIIRFGTIGTYLFEIIIITILFVVSHTLISIFLILIVFVDLILHSPKSKHAVFGIVFYGYSLFLFLIRLDAMGLRKLLIYFLVFTALYIIVWIIVAMVHYMVSQNEIIDQAYKNMSIKNIELEKLYHSLKQAYEKLEEITILRERHRVARELHDTIGHTVTKALISVEATKVLMDTDPTKALDRLMITEDSLRDGLRDIRSILHLLDQEIKESSLLEEIDELIGSVREQTGVHVEMEIMDFKVDQQRQKHILRILQEGLTNGLKHGEATAFFFKLTHNGKEIQILLSDNGIGAASIKKGFGLLNMEERVRELKGELKIDSVQGEGFTLNIRLPLIKGENNEKDSRIAH